MLNFYPKFINDLDVHVSTMNAIQRIFKNVISLSVSKISFSILSLLLTIFIARLLGDVSLGKYSFAITFPKLFLVFMDLGYETFFIREVSRNKSLTRDYLESLLGFRLLLIPVVLLTIAVSINLMGYQENTKFLVYIFSIYYVILSLSSLYKISFRSFEKMEYEAGILIISTIFRTSCSVILLYFGYGLLEIGIVFILSAILEFGIGFILNSKLITTAKINFNYTFIKNTIRLALPFCMLSLFGLVYVKIDTVMLSYIEGDAVVGWYNAAYNLTLTFRSIPLLLMNALFPLLSNYYISSKESLKKGFQLSFKYLFSLGLPLSVGIFILADKIILFFYGFGFTESIIALKILSWDVLLKFLYICTQYILIAINKQKSVGLLIIFTSFFNIVLNLALIPKFSYIGSGIATLLSESILLISFLYVSKTNSYHIKIKSFLFQTVIACAIMILFLNYFSFLNLFIQIILSIFIYFVVFIILKGFSKDDITIFKRLLHKKSV